jgi:hypothetical protein
MFGQNDQDDDISAVNPTLDGDTAPAASDAPADTSAAAPATDSPVIEPTTDSPVTDTAEAAVTPETTPEVTPEVTAPTDTPEVPETTPEETPSVDTSSSDTATDEPATSTPSADDSALLDLKKQALEELSPLLDQLDQTPEEKFKTTMMMIQATDSSDLVTAAHEAALHITDEKVRAQALLDIVNEINYFTQPKE